MRKIFDNIHAIPEHIVRLRLINIDDEPHIETYSYISLEDETETHYLSIETIATETQINAALASPVTQTEINYLMEFAADKVQVRQEYQSTIDQLQNIENATNPTNTQVVAAVKFLARTIRLMLRLLAKIYMR